MALTLPYAFDTTKSGKLILKGTMFIQALMSIELPYFFIFEPYKLINFGLVSVVLLSLGVFIFKRIGGAFGTITDREITVGPSVLWGIRSTSPEGRFPLTQFRCIRVAIIAAGRNGPHERVCLVGRDGTPDIEFARTQQKEGIALGHALGALIGLSVEETRAPY
jgi:hypothetical protein